MTIAIPPIKCKSTGQRLWDALQDKLNDDNAQDVIQYDGTLAADYEDDDVERDQTPDPFSWKNIFKDRNLDFKGHFAVHDVRSNGGTTSAYLNEFNTNQGTIINMWNFKEHDTMKTMPFSEVVLQCYKKECDEEDELKKFQFAGVANVINQDYLKVVDAVYNKPENSRREKVHNKFEKWTYEDNQDDFLTLLGTPKLGYVLRMLTDHSVAFDKRIPTELWINKRRREAYVIIDKFKN